MVSIRQWITVLASTLLLTGCERSQDAGKTPADEALAPSEILPVDPPLDREGLLRAVGRAASDFASGLEDRDRQLQLDGRLFEVRLRFGCAGDAIETREWSFDEGQRVLRVRVEPELTSDSAALEALNLEGFEAVEGFWIRRPWLLEAACPAVREISPAADATAAPDPAAQPAADTETDPDADNNALSPRVGIAHFFTEQDSRARRRDSRAYQATVKLAEGETPSAAGYDLVLSGRLERLTDGRVIACSGDVASAPPRCIVSATFDHVSLNRPDGTQVAQWSGG